MSNCRCYYPPLDFRDYDSVEIGTDMTNGRYGQVSIETCKQCRTKWLHYFVEYESFTASGRWFRGLIEDTEVADIKPEEAITFLEKLPWHFVGGSYYQSHGQRSSGVIRADL